MQKVSGRLNRRCHGNRRDLVPAGRRPAERGLLMAQVALPGPSTFPAAVPCLFGWARILMPLLLVAGCASWHRPLPIPPEVTEAGVAARVLVSPDLNVNPAETVVKPGTPGQASSDASGSRSLELERTDRK